MSALPEPGDIPPASPEDAACIFEVSERSPLQALASAYADRLMTLRAMAGAQEIADSTALIADLERLCLRSSGPH